jgi:hypothetical protein
MTALIASARQFLAPDQDQVSPGRTVLEHLGGDAQAAISHRRAAEPRESGSRAAGFADGARAASAEE